MAAVSYRAKAAEDLAPGDVIKTGTRVFQIERIAGPAPVRTASSLIARQAAVVDAAGTRSALAIYCGGDYQVRDNPPDFLARARAIDVDIARGIAAGPVTITAAQLGAA